MTNLRNIRGNLVATPVLNNVGSGRPVINFTVAVNGRQNDPTEFVRCGFFIQPGDTRKEVLLKAAKGQGLNVFGEWNFKESVIVPAEYNADGSVLREARINNYSQLNTLHFDMLPQDSGSVDVQARIQQGVAAKLAQLLADPNAMAEHFTKALTGATKPQETASETPMKITSETQIEEVI